jgi:hypothetical protein
MDRLADARIGAAPTEVPGHGGIDVRVARSRLGCEQRGRRHDLSRLTVAALRNVELDPGALHGVAAIGGQPLDGSHSLAGERAERQHAGAHCGPVDVHRAGAAQCHTTAVLRSGHREVIAQDPQERGIGRGVHVDRAVVDGYQGHRRVSLERFDATRTREIVGGNGAAGG